MNNNNKNVCVCGGEFPFGQDVVYIFYSLLLKLDPHTLHIPKEKERWGNPRNKILLNSFGFSLLLI